MKKPKGKVILSLLVIFCIILGGAWWVKDTFFNDPMTTHIDPETGKTIKAFNVLLLGSDARPGEKLGRTDTIIAAQISEERIAMLSIPRDTRVQIPGRGYQKINAAAVYEGPELTAELVSDLIGQPVDKYMMVRWEGFVDSIDTLGGVDVHVAKDFSAYAFDGDKQKIHFREGIQHLNGREALAFVRYRSEAQGDIFRVGQQLELMKALVEQCKQPSTLLKLPLIVPDLYKNVETNMKLKELVALAKAGMNFKDSSVLTQTLPGYFLNIDGISYWGVDPEQARRVAYDLFFNGQTTSKVVQATPENMKPKPKQNQQVAQQPQEESKTPPKSIEVTLPPKNNEEDKNNDNKGTNPSGDQPGGDEGKDTDPNSGDGPGEQPGGGPGEQTGGDPDEQTGGGPGEGTGEAGGDSTDQSGEVSTEPTGSA